MTRKKRGLSAEDEALWAEVARSVTPLNSDRAADPLPKRRHRPALRPADPMEAPPGPGPVSLDRKTARKIARGQIAVDRHLDLHGKTQEQAFQALLSAVRQEVARGSRCLVVVTGRGGRRFSQTRDVPAAYRRREDFAPEGGVLKRQVPLWLEGPELSGFVYAYGPAADSHGGAGALYVVLRRRR